MSRPAGFSIVATVSQTLANEYIRVYFANNIPPQPIPLPPTVTVAGLPVSVSGQVSLLPPEVVFTQNVQDLITTNLAVAGTLQFSAAGIPSQSVQVALYATVALPLSTQSDGTLSYPGINLSQVTITALGVEVLPAPPQPPPSLDPRYKNVLNSKEVLDAIMAGVRSFKPLTLPVGPLTLPLGTLLKVPRAKPVGKGVSEFEVPTWFQIDLTMTRLVPRVFNGDLTVGVDLNNYTQGDGTQLVDLNASFAPGPYVETNYSDGRSVMQQKPGGARNGDFAVLLTAPALSAIVANQISDPITGTLVDDHVEMRGLDVQLGYYDAGVDGTGYGASAKIDVRYDTLTKRLNDGWGYFGPVEGSPNIDVSVSFHVQYYLSTREGDTSWVAGRPDQWEAKVVDPEISLPVWLEPALVFGAIVLPAAVLPLLVMYSWLAGIFAGSLLETTLSNANYQVGDKVNDKLSDAKQLAQKTMALPKTNNPQWLARLGDVTLTEDGVDASLKFSPSERPDLVLNGTPTLLGTDAYRWSVYDPQPMVVTLQVADGNYRADDPTLFADWQVVREDTKQAVLKVTQQLSAQSGVASVTIDHNSAALSPAPGFVVSCRFYRLLGYRTDEVYSGQMQIEIDDLFDRHHPYVRWNHVVHFPNPNFNPKIKQKGVPPSWSRSRTSVIHRTQADRRCLEMRRRPAYHNMLEMPFIYMDSLPNGALDAKPGDVSMVCQYCFFGGPDKHTLLP